MGKNNMMNEEPENKVPFGSLEEEVADDIPVMLSEGEYVIPADVVRYWGLKHLEEMRMMAKCGLMSMQQDGRLHMVDEEGEPVETDMPEAPQIEVVEIDIQAMQDDMSEEEEDEDDDDMDKQMEMFEDNVIEVDFDGKDEEKEDNDNVLKMFEGGTPTDADAAAAAGVDQSGMSGPEGSVPDSISTPPSGINQASRDQDKGFSPYGVDIFDTVDIATANKARSYGITPEQLAKQEDIAGFVDAVADARHANNPTSNQMDLNAMTEKGFQTANPGVVGVTNALAGTLASMNPAIAATLAVGNIVNAATGRETIAGFGVPSIVGEVFGLGETSIAQAIGEQLSGLAQDVVDFSETVPGNIEDTIDAGVEAGKEAGSSDDDQQKRQTQLPDMTKLLSLTTQLQGIDKRVPIRNSLMSQAINNNRASQPITT